MTKLNYYLFNYYDDIDKQESSLRLLDNESLKKLHRIVIKEYLRRLKEY